jgi:hypothetical protein
MPLPLPNLDDRRYADLVDEARALIPALDPQWTNHNASDPGITLLELFAWLTEMLLYRIDRASERHVADLLKLLRDPDEIWVSSGDPIEDTSRTLRALRHRYRAVTEADYESLALQAPPPAGGDVVARARCVPRVDLSLTSEAARLAPQPGHVSVILVPGGAATTPTWPSAGSPPTGSSSVGSPPRVLPPVGSPPVGSPFVGSPPGGSPPAPQPGGLAPFQPSAALVQSVSDYLEPRRMLTTRNHVVGPILAPINAEILIARKPDTREPAGGDMLSLPAGGVAPDDVRRRVLEALTRFLDPLVGGADQRGWPFGRAVYVSELYAVLAAVQGVDYVPEIWLSSECPPGVDRCQPASLEWQPDGEQVGLTLAAHHLPWSQIDPRAVVFSSAFLQVRVDLKLTPTPNTSPEDACRAARIAIRNVFHPLHDGPDGTSDVEIGTLDILSAVRRLPQIASVDDVQLTADPSRTRFDEIQNQTLVRFARYEVADVQTSVGVSAP